jgi:hypothetical protein
MWLAEVIRISGGFKGSRLTSAAFSKVLLDLPSITMRLSGILKFRSNSRMSADSETSTKGLPLPPEITTVGLSIRS